MAKTAAPKTWSSCPTAQACVGFQRLTGAVVHHIPLPAYTGVRLAAHGRREASPGPLSRIGRGVGERDVMPSAPALP